MLNKNRLMTGVVFPLMSIAIAAQPAAAMPFRSGSEAPHARAATGTETFGQIILAQAEPSAPAAEGAPAAEEVPPPKKRKPVEEPAAEAPAPEPKRQEQRAPEPLPEPAQQPEPEAKPRAERPRNAEPEQRAAPADAPVEPQAERPKRQREQPQTDGEPKPERPARAQKPQNDGEPKPERPRKQEPAAAEPQAPVEPKAAAEPKAPADEAPTEPKPARKPAEEVAPAKGAAPAEAVPEKKPEALAPEPKAAPVPTESPAPEKPPAPGAQPNPAPGQQPSEQTRPPRGQQSGEQQAPIPNAPPPAADGTATGQAPAGEPVPAQIAVPQQEAPPSTKEELDKARAVAKDPSKSADTVILPIDKGAAVLDSDKEAERSGNQQSRDQRRQEREAAKDFKVPTSDAESQATRGRDAPQITIQAITTVQGERVDRRPDYDRPEGIREWQPRGGPRDRDMGDRVFLQYGDRVVVRGDDNDRFVRDGAEPYYERLPEGRVRETVERRDGTQVVTIRNRYGDVIQRSRIDDRGREYVLFYAPELVDEPDREYVYRDPGLDLPPMRLRIPVQDYIIDTSSDPDRDYYRFLEQPPVEPVERVYSLDEVRYSARIRDKVRRIDLDTITFATGSAEIPMSQAQSLRKVADAMNKALEKNPAETFLIEGHTDAVGNDESNLVLSDERAASVANVLTDVYGIPPENFATQGYGERFLKVQTLGASQENRRVTIRRITPLVKPVAQK